jgi:hypothetical protein
VQSPDITAIRVSNNDGDLYAFNIYLDQHHSDMLFEINRTMQGIKQEVAQSQ